MPASALGWGLEIARYALIAFGLRELLWPRCPEFGGSWRCVRKRWHFGRHVYGEVYHR